MPRTAARPSSDSTLGFTAEFQAQRQDALFRVLLSFVFAVAETLAVYLVLSLIYRTPPLESFMGRIPDTSIPWLPAVMLSRGPLQPLNLCLFSFGATLLILRQIEIVKEFKAFSLPFFAGIPTNERNEPLIVDETRSLPLQNIRQIAKEFSGTMPLLVRRLEAGSLRLAEEGDATQVHAVMQSVGEIDRDALESRYTLVRYLIWLIPTIGFLGTVMGIGRAISGFSAFLSEFGGGGGDFASQLQPVLGGVAGELGFAFEATGFALFLSAVIVALTSIAQTREEGLLSSIDEFCLRYFVSRVAVPDFGAKQMSVMLQQAFMAMAEGRAGGSDGGVSLQEIAGKLDHVNHVLSEGGASGESAALASIQQSAQSFADSAEKIRKALDNR